MRPVQAEVMSPTSLSDDDFHRIDAYIESQLADTGIPGAALVIVEGDQITHVRGYGVAGEDGRPVTAESGFYIGSLTKSFTAVAIMQLVEAEHVELDAPVQKYLPWFHVADPRASSQLKVKHLLNHTSGFSTYSGRTHLTDSDTSTAAIERRVRALGNTELARPVGAAYQYSNANYVVLGAIIEAVSGQSYEEYIEQHIFEPLSMTRSYTSEAAARKDNLATGFRYWFGQAFSTPSVSRPRGELPSMFLISSAQDMGNYLLAHMNGGAFGETRLLSESGVSQLHTPERGSLNYAMGWEVKMIDNVQALNHIGTTPTFQAGMTIFPEQRRGFALLINSQNQLSGPDVASLVPMVELNMIGVMALPIAKAPKLHLNLALLTALFVGQTFGFIFTLRNVFRTCKSPQAQSRRGCMGISSQGWLYLAIDVGIVIGMLCWIPQSNEAPISAILLYAPDAGWLIVLNAILAIMSAVTAILVAALSFQSFERGKLIRSSA